MLLAQSSSTVTHSTWPAMMLGAGGGLMLVFILFLVLLFRHLRTSRQLLHVERMRSLEAGIPLEAPEETKLQSKFQHNAFWISFWMVFSVPGAALSAASAATQTSALALSILIWVVAAVVSVAAVVCAAILMIYSRGRRPDDADLLRRAPKLM
jgi:hypothetical protein